MLTTFTATRVVLDENPLPSFNAPYLLSIFSTYSNYYGLGTGVLLLAENDVARLCAWVTEHQHAPFCPTLATASLERDANHPGIVKLVYVVWGKEYTFATLTNTQLVDAVETYMAQREEPVADA